MDGFKAWKKYLSEENDIYKNNPVLSTIIFSAVTKGLRGNRRPPEILNPGVLADTTDEISKNLKTNPKYTFDFLKVYKNKLQAFALGPKEVNTGETETKWVKIPSLKNDPDNFEKNVEKLKILSYKSWCTKSYNAKPYLKRSDFYIYLDKGQPKAAIRMVGDKICEIQGEKNDGCVPWKYCEEIENFIEKKRLYTDDEIQKSLTDAKLFKTKVDMLKKELDAAIKNNDVKTILEKFGIKCTEHNDGTYAISSYRQPSDDITFSDLGIKENLLFKKIRHLKGHADFQYSQISNLGQLQSIGGNADFWDSQFQDLGQLQSIGGNAYFRNSQVEDLGQLQSIGGNANFRNSQV